MTSSEAERKRLRKLLNERIPEGGTDADTDFSDEEIDSLVTETSSIYEAASLGWTEKAASLQGEVEEYSAGDESYSYTSLKDKLNHALKMADHYGSMTASVSKSSSGAMLRINKPRVL